MNDQLIIYLGMIVSGIAGFFLFYFFLPELDKRFNIGQRLSSVSAVLATAETELGPILSVLPYGSFMENVLHLATIGVGEANQVYEACETAKKKGSATDLAYRAFALGMPNHSLTDSEKLIINSAIEYQVWVTKKLGGTISTKIDQSKLPGCIKSDIDDSIKEIEQVDTPNADKLVQDVEQAFTI